MADLFSNYNFHAKTWADLVKSDARQGNEANRSTYHDTSGTGLLNRGAVRYQMLVPSYTVMFAFFLVLPSAGCSSRSGSTARCCGCGPPR